MARVDCVTLALVADLESVLRIQDGVIRRDQALAAGLSESAVNGLVNRKCWVRLLPRVYSATTGDVGIRARIRATWLWAGEDSVIGGTAAAWWWGLTDVEPTRIEVVVPPSRRMTRQPGVDLLRGVRTRHEVVLHDRIAVTTPAATCLRLSRVGAPDLLDVALRGGLRQTALHQALALGFRRRGQVRARVACADVADNPWSNPERALHSMFRDAGVRGWTGNPPVLAGGRLWYPDVLVEEVGLVIEVDGRATTGRTSSGMPIGTARTRLWRLVTRSCGSPRSRSPRSQRRSSLR